MRGLIEYLWIALAVRLPKPVMVRMLAYRMRQPNDDEFQAIKQRARELGI